MFIAVLFTDVRTRKQPQCPPTDEWTQKPVRPAVGYHSAVAKGGVLPFAASRMDLDIVTLRDVRARPGEVCVASLTAESKKK